MNKPNLIALLMAATLANIASKANREEGAPGELPDLDTILSGARQKGEPIFTNSTPTGGSSVFEALFNRKYEEPVSLLEALEKPWLIPSIRNKARGDIVIGALRPNGDCDCEFCSWVREQMKEMGVHSDSERFPDPDMAAAAQRMDAEVADFRNEVASPSVTGHWEVRRRAATVPEILRKGADTYEERNPLYGDSYKVYGAVMKAMFPDGLPDMATVADFNRLGVFNMIVSKLMRYASNIGNGGHFDSALDLSVYAAMLAELTEEEGK